MDINAIREIVRIAKRMDDLRITNAYEGNVSIKKDGLLYITPSGKNKGFLTESMVAVVDESGKQIAGPYRPSSELNLHTAMYQMRDDIGGVVHAHSPFLTAFAMCGMSFEFPEHAEFVWDHKCAQVLPYGRPGSCELFAGADKILAQGRNIFLLANHGVVTVGPTLLDALNTLESAEHAAKIYTITKLIGKPSPLPAGEVELLMSL